MLEYDLVHVFDHPLRFRHALAAAIAVFGGTSVGGYRIRCRWKHRAGDAGENADLLLRWDTATLRPQFAEVDEEVAIRRERSEDRAQLVEDAAIIVAIAVMSQLAPGTRFTHWSRVGSAHDFRLNDRNDEMIEVKGRFRGGLPSLFAAAKEQSQRNAAVSRRWISVTVFAKNPRNRTEGLHP